MPDKCPLCGDSITIKVYGNTGYIGSFGQKGCYFVPCSQCAKSEIVVEPEPPLVNTPHIQVIYTVSNPRQG